MIESLTLVQMLVVATVTFLVAMAFTPIVTKILYKYKLGKTIRDAKEAPIFYRLHKKKSGTPTMGGVVVWIPVLAVALLLHQLATWSPDLDWLDFLSREETWLPLGALVASACVGLVDDYLNTRGIGGHGGGLRVRHRLAIYTAIAFVGAWWFTFKLDWDLLHVPFFGTFNIGLWYALFFLVVIVATSFSVNQTDGLDGLAGGTLLTSFTAYGVIALLQGREDLAVLCAAIAGGLLALFWVNINPAPFFMGDAGSMSLGVTLGIVAMLTNQALL